MEKGKKKLRRSVGILLTLVLLCGILHGGSGLFGVVAQEEGAGDGGAGLPDGAKVWVHNNFAGEGYYSESLTEAFGKLNEVVGGSGGISSIRLLGISPKACYTLARIGSRSRRTSKVHSA